MRHRLASSYAPSAREEYSPAGRDSSAAGLNAGSSSDFCGAAHVLGIVAGCATLTRLQADDPALTLSPGESCARSFSARRSRSSAVRNLASHTQSAPACSALIRCQAASRSSLSIFPSVFFRTSIKSPRVSPAQRIGKCLVGRCETDWYEVVLSRREVNICRPANTVPQTG